MFGVDGSVLSFVGSAIAALALLDVLLRGLFLELLDRHFRHQINLIQISFASSESFFDDYFDEVVLAQLEGVDFEVLVALLLLKLQVGPTYEV